MPFVLEVSASITSYIVEIIYIALGWITAFYYASLNLKNLNLLHQTINLSC